MTFKTWNRLSFRAKLRVAFLAITMLSIFITGGLSYTITANILETNAMKLTQDTVETSAQSLDEKLGKLMLVMMTFMISEPFKEMLRDVSMGNGDNYYTHLSNLDNVFSQARIAEPLIQSIYVSTPMGEFYPLTMNRNRAVSFYDTPLYERIAKEKRAVWIEGHADELFAGDKRVVSLVLEAISSAVHPVKDVYVVVNIREDGLRKLVGPESESGAIRVLLNGAGRPVYPEANALARQATSGPLAFDVASAGAPGYRTAELGKETYLLNYAPLGLNDWTILTVQSQNRVLRDLIYVKWMIVAIAAASLFVTALLSGAFTRYLLKPLQALQHVMKRVEANDLTARFESDKSDELAQAGFRFNRMLEQIVRLIDEVKTAESSKRAAEIKSLSAQMDPHFLYNTLNAIYWKLKLNQVEKSQGMVVALSRLFQLGLNKGQEMTTLAKELEHVRQYLELQSDCYESLFEYEIDVRDPSLLELPVPRIVLQPLVENSILHGFESMEYGGRIDIVVEGDPTRDACAVRVTDNGCGMDAAAVQASYAREAGPGVAIGNLVSRFQLFYGGEASFAIDSEPGRGTTVTLTIPTTFAETASPNAPHDEPDTRGGRYHA